eukprot:6187954-Pleurochrysis_carterae.AAC.1
MDCASNARKYASAPFPHKRHVHRQRGAYTHGDGPRWNGGRRARVLAAIAAGRVSRGSGAFDESESACVGCWPRAHCDARRAVDNLVEDHLRQLQVDTAHCRVVRKLRKHAL